MLAERVDGVIGVDTHRDTLAAAAVSPIGAVLASTAAINQFKSLIVSAPDDLRAELRRLKRPAQISRCAQLRDRPTQGIEHRMTVRALRSTAQRVQALQAEAKELENEILNLVRQMAPELLDLQGGGPITAAQVLVSWSHPGRFRSEAAFASFAGVSPIPASSGLTNRHRINRSGDRQLNRALHTITLIRMQLDPLTKAYVARRLAEGKTSRDAQRCLKRAVCRQLFKILERSDPSPDGNHDNALQQLDAT
ncbi:MULTISPECIES: transposase [unclassified Streptomyces]|uniref:transposase n=1 Tax=Streptomyces sp. NBC_01794 TaxID=2975942 RepID=UPI002DDC86C0|nr:transposase [Streptomyces sp. NBC_01750]WSB05235.1 transposase [Streptomyces sp. NBC_01794]WSD38042.1 transposase [Streptomyces sp. NBC_01750]